jgi:hypothetical protein
MMLNLWPWRWQWRTYQRQQHKWNGVYKLTSWYRLRPYNETMYLGAGTGAFIHTALPVQLIRIQSYLSTIKTRPKIGCRLKNLISVPTIFGKELEKGQNYGFDPIQLNPPPNNQPRNEAPQVVFHPSGESTVAGRASLPHNTNHPTQALGH